ncbi:MAG: hypothetical protein E6Q97_29095 [Desulfurellales bacterium]|nr:MAG: hypothetical protein E6Q97_29095 [Desulfurellales bacterium]
MNYLDHDTINAILDRAHGVSFVEREALEEYLADPVRYWQDRVWMEGQEWGGRLAGDEADAEERPFEAMIRRINSIVQNHAFGL